MGVVSKRVKYFQFVALHLRINAICAYMQIKKVMGTILRNGDMYSLLKDRLSMYILGRMRFSLEVQSTSVTTHDMAKPCSVKRKVIKLPPNTILKSTHP